MIPAKRKEPSATSLEFQEDLSRDAIVTAFQNAMADHLRSHIPGTSINEETLLATDYLNQFHELVRKRWKDRFDFDEGLEDWVSVSGLVSLPDSVPTTNALCRERFNTVSDA